MHETGSVKGVMKPRHETRGVRDIMKTRHEVRDLIQLRLETRGVRDLMQPTFIREKPLIDRYCNECHKI